MAPEEEGAENKLSMVIAEGLPPVPGSQGTCWVWIVYSCSS